MKIIKGSAYSGTKKMQKNIFIEIIIMKGYCILLLVSFLLLTVQSFAQKTEYVISSPSGSDVTHIDKSGISVIPNGRIITPAGKCFTVAPHPYGLALSNDGNIAVTANSGTSPLSITILRNLLSGNPEIQQIPPSPKGDEGVLASVFMGLAI